MNKYYLEKADINTPKLYETEVISDNIVDIVPDETAFFGVRAVPLGKNKEAFVTGEKFILDFGDHCVGTLSFRLRHEARYLDAPVRLKLRFGETAYELSRDFSTYHGGLCPSWLQEDIVTVDFPEIVHLVRRYCFRYLEVTVINTPNAVRLTDFTVTGISSANYANLEPLPHGTDPELVAIDRVAAKTLADCMQTAYEDGPKRDRRLWTGDLRLQALTDYYLFKNDRLARRCLYLFAACEEEGKYLPGCLYQKPSVFFDDGMGICDYAMLFCSALCDYYEHTGDTATASDIYPVAQRQMDLACSCIREDGSLRFLDGWFSFIDWAPDIQRMLPCLGVVLYSMEKMACLARALGDTEHADVWSTKLADTREKVYANFFDKTENCFITDKYEKRQYSVQAQAWLILGGVITGDEAVSVLRGCLSSEESLKPVTPYMHHYVVDAMVKLGLTDEAKDYVKSYWGSMIKNGADTFWEAYDPKNPELSPYSDVIMNSFCHAWSCSPSYFIRRYFVK
ncbi:MAG: hypothetical protein IJ449_04605 [Clostridia bacterium]|nr:hypothetical protein [Clostridia bacterium]